MQNKHVNPKTSHSKTLTGTIISTFLQIFLVIWPTYCTFTTFTCNGLFSQCGIRTSTEVKDLNTPSTAFSRR